MDPRLGESVQAAIRQSELFVEARYASPAFDLLKPGGVALHEHMFPKLQPFGFRATEIRQEGEASDYSTLNATYRLGLVNGLVRFWIDRLEFSVFDFNSVGTEKASEALVAVLDGFHEALPKLEMLHYSVTVSFHASFERTKAPEFLDSFLKLKPKGVGPVTSNGVVYYFGPDAERIGSTLVLDQSMLVTDGVFGRASATFDAKRVSSQVLPGVSEIYFESLFNSVNLELN